MAKSLCIYGPTGSRKTTQVKWFAHYIADVTGKSTLLLSLSDGGWSPMCDPEVNCGMIIPYKAEVSVTPLMLLRKISQGYWPAHPESINEALIKIAAEGPQQQTLVEASLIPVDWSRVGGIAIEGWSSISNVVMRHLSDKGINVGGENRFSVFKNGASSSFAQSMVVNGEMVTENFGSNILPDYNFSQNTMASLISNWNSLPVNTVLHTALEGKTTEDGQKTGAPVYGPLMEGKKATAQCGSWVGDLIHAQDYAIPKTVLVPKPGGAPGETMEQTVVQDTVRFFYRKHPDPDTGIIFPAKPRCAPERILELEKEMPGGFFEPGFGEEWGVDRYLHLMDRLAADASKGEALLNWRDRADKLLGRK